MFHELPDLDDPAVIGNLIESIIWGVFAAGIAIKGLRCDRVHRCWLLVLAAGFFVFGFSDVIEAWTGAWWRPWWLLVLKLACVTSFLCVGWHYRRISGQAWKSDVNLRSQDPHEPAVRNPRQ